MTPNVHLLRLTLNFIEQNPDQWDQASWKSCFGGLALHFAGVDTWTDSLDGFYYDLSATGEHPDEHPSYRADRVLGIDCNDRHGLYRVGNTISDLRRIVDNLTAADSTVS
jgi:hypothetical protein